MYAALFLLLLGCGAGLIFFGLKRHDASKVFIGAAVAVFTFAFFWILDFWGEMLWFEALGYSGRFWTVVLAKIATAASMAVIGWGVVFLLTLSIPKDNGNTRRWARLIGALFGGMWGFTQWETLLIFFNRVSTRVEDPILSMDTGFYMFILPFLDALYRLFFQLAMIALVAIAITLFVRFSRDRGIEFDQAEKPRIGPGSYRLLYINAAFLLFVLACGKFLNRYHLMYSGYGVVTGPGWTDEHVRLPAYWVVIILTVLIGFAILNGKIRGRIQAVMEKLGLPRGQSHVAVLAGAAALTAVVWFLSLSAAPQAFQALMVEPNEITFEEYYIANNIQFTRRGFELDTIEEREFPAAEKFTREMVDRNPDLFNNIRLWDWRALDAVYKQFQEIRLYYEFVDVDIDRYTFGGDYRQVMISAREMEQRNLPQQSRTFVNKRFKYTHGFGITLTNVSEFTPQGLPDLLVKNIPPVSGYPELEVKQPRIYYGELTDTHVVVDSEETEFDYPEGDANVYNHYDGAGGVQMSNLWRKFLYGWRFDGTRFLLSGYPTPESRIMFRRNIRERVRELAPFLDFDSDPYIVLADGRLYWIIDAYATSEYYPYSEPFSAREMIEFSQQEVDRTLFAQKAGYLEGVNYIRNSVKAVVDAYNGSVDFYIFEPDDPVIQVWNRIFPDLFKPGEQMPESLLRHIRYPSDLLLVQGLVLTKYHMTDPQVFYNQEDLWIRATEKYYNRVQPVQPYYIMWKPPQSEKLQFTLILPFTPKKRQVLIGWIAGMCDPPDYGKLIVYKFPKDQRVLGPQQVETKIDQDRFLSGQLTLWDQRGSNVIRGNVLAIPVEDTLFYVEPIYLQAETAAYPELRLVAVMQNDRLSYAESFDKALAGIFEGGEAPTPAVAIGEAADMNELIQQANTAFEDYLRYLGEKQFDRSSQALGELQQTLEQLTRTSQAPPPPEAGFESAP